MVLGTYTHLGTLYVGTGDKIVAATADLTIQDNFRINDNIRVTNYGSISVLGPYGIWGDNTGMTWVNETDATLNSGGSRVFNNGGSGTLVASATGNTVEYSRTNALPIETPVGNTYFNLVISGSNVKTVQANLNITGDLTISSTLNANNLDIRLVGDWINTGFFTEGTGTLTLDGNSDQTITNPLGETYYNLVINKGAGTAILNNNVTVSNSLALTNGIVVTGTNALTLGTSAASIGTYTRINGWVNGQMERWMNSTGTDYDIPVGSTSEYRPALINFNALSSNGSLITSFISSSPGNDGLPLTESSTDINNTFAEGYWSMIKANSLESNDYNLALTGNGFTSFTITDETRLLTRATGMTDWTLSGNHVPAAGTTAARDNISILSAEFAFGDTSNCTAPVTPPISGSSQRCINNTGIPYFVTDNPGSTYTWQITGGTVATGQGTSSITVDWGPVAMLGQVLVVENNGCTDGAPEVLDVEIGPLPTSIITGPIAVANGELGVSYTVDANAGYSYNWTVSPEGSITSGQGTNAVTVDWSSTGTATLSVVGSNSCGDADQVDLFIEVYDVFVSATSGDWAAGGTWVGGVAPTSVSSARIAPGHIVAIYSNTTINNITVDNGAILNTRNNYFYVNGNYILNGRHAGYGGDRVRLGGTDAVIDGIGNYTHTGRLYLSAGNKTIASGANLTLAGSLLIANNLIVTNQGSITVGNDINCNANTTWINAENSTLILQDDFTSGTLITSSLNNRMVYDGSVNNTIRRPQNDTYYHLEIRGSGNKTLPSALTIMGDLTIAGPLVSNNFNINLGGDWTNTASFSEGTGTVTMIGTGDQQITNPVGEIFYGLTISKSTGHLDLDNDVTVSNTLTMTEGVIDAGTNTIVLGTGTGNVGTLSYASGRIIGPFKRWIDAAGTWLFPVGTANHYRPADVTFNNVTGGTVTTEFLSSDPGNNGLPLDDGGQNVVNTFTEGYWSMLRGDGLTTSDYDLLLTANGFTSFTPTDETRLLLRPNPGSNWIVDGTHVGLAGEAGQQVWYGYTFCRVCPG